MNVIKKVYPALNGRGLVKAALPNNRALLLNNRCDTLSVYVRCVLSHSRPVYEFVSRNRTNAKCIEVVSNESGTMVALLIEYGRAVQRKLIIVPSGNLFTMRWDQYNSYDLQGMAQPRSFSMIFWTDDLLLVSYDGRFGTCKLGEGVNVSADPGFFWNVHLAEMSDTDRDFHTDTNRVTAMARGHTNTVFFAIYGRLYEILELTAENYRLRRMAVMDVGAIGGMARIWQSMFMVWDGCFTLSVVNVRTGVVLKRYLVPMSSSGARPAICPMSHLGACVSLPMEAHEVQSLRMSCPGFMSVILYRDRYFFRIRVLQRMHHAAARKGRNLGEMFGSRGKILLVTLPCEVFMGIMRFYLQMSPGF
jgi:hypothetical protein